MTDGLTDAVYRGLPDDAIWACIRERRDEVALRAFLHRHGGRLLACAGAVTGDEHAAQDAVQEAMIRLIRDRDRLPNHRAAMAWLYVAVNRAARTLRRSERRRKAREQQVSFARPEEVSSSDPDMGEIRGTLDRAVADLPARERQAVELVYYEGLTHADAAETLGWSRGAVGSYLSRALRRLEGLLAKRGVKASVSAALGMAAELRAEIPAATVATLSAAVGAATESISRSALPWAVAVAIIATSLGVIGLSLAPPEGPARRFDPTPQLAAPSPSPVETRNLTEFDRQVRDRLQDALEDMIVGDSGRAEITSVTAVTTRIIVTVAVTHGKPGLPPTKLWLAVETLDLDTYMLADVDGSGFHWPVQFHNMPVTWKQGFPNHRLRLGAFDKARKALLAMPTTPWAKADELRVRAKTLPVIEAASGEWERAGQRYRIVAKDANGFALELYRTAPFREALALSWNTIWRLPNGSVMANLIYDCGVITISADGSRITGPTGEEWRRVPPL